MALKGRAKAESKHQWGTQILVGSEVINKEMDESDLIKYIN